MERTLSSKRSGAGAALVPSGMTERQMLAMALEESRRAAVAAKHTAMQEEEGGSSDESSSDDESSAGGARARGSGRQQQQQQRGAGDSKSAKRRRPRQQPAGNAKEGKAAGTPRKRARMEPTEFRTATSSENSKASRTTQQLLDLGGSVRGSLEGSLTAADVAAAAGQRRGDSADSEHNSISGGSGQNLPQDDMELGKPKQEASSEGAGESGGSEQQRPGSAAPDQDVAGKLDARTIAEMARKRRERFGTSCEPATTHKPAPKPLRRAPSGVALPQKLGSSLSGAQLEVVARSRSSLAALVESDLFPDTPRRGAAASKTATPAVTPTLVSAEAAARESSAREVTEDQKPSLCGSAAAAVAADSGASPVRTPSPVAGSPRSLQGSELHDSDLAGDVTAKLGDVKREDTADAQQGTGPQAATCGEQPPAPKQPKQRRKPGPSPKQPRLSALQVPRDSPDSAMLDPLVKAERTPAHGPRKGRAGSGANRAARSISRTPSRNLRWASTHLSSPAGGLGRRLRSAVVEEFKHNTDASDPFAWQPQTPARARASALLAACAVLAAQDKQLSAPEALSPRPTGQQPPEPCPVKQQRQQQRQQEQMDAVRQYQLQQSPAKKADNASMVAVPAPMQAGGDRPSVAACDERPSQAQGMDARAPDQASAMEVDLELSAEEPATPPVSPSCERAKPPADAFTTPARQMLRGSSVEFPALEQGASPAPTPVLCTPAGKWRPLWKKLHPLCLDFQGPSEQQAEQSRGPGAPSAGGTPAPARQHSFAATLPSPARVHVADAAAQVCAAFKGRHGLEGRRLELSSSCTADEPGMWRPEASAAAQNAAPFQGSRLGKALAACYGRSRSNGAAAAFSGGCADLRAPYTQARNTPAWRSAAISRSGSAGSSCGLSVNPHLARQRTQRNLQNTWDDLLARQALEACTAEALVAWAKPDEASA